MTTSWDVLGQLIENTSMPENIKEKIIIMGKVLFKETHHLSEKMKLITIITTASLTKFEICENAYLDYAESAGLSNSFIRSLIDNMKEYSIFEKNEMAIIQIVTEITTNSSVFPSTLEYARKHFTQKEIEYIIFLSGYINFIAKIYNVEMTAKY